MLNKCCHPCKIEVVYVETNDVRTKAERELKLDKSLKKIIDIEGEYSITGTWSGNSEVPVLEDPNNPWWFECRQDLSDSSRVPD